MPDLNKADNYIQIAVCRDDENIFDLWYKRYLNKKNGWRRKNGRKFECIYRRKNKYI